MASFLRSRKNTRSIYDYKFEWTENHMSAEELHPMMNQRDELADEAVAILDKISPPLPHRRAYGAKVETDGEKKEVRPDRDLYCLLRDNAENDPVLKQLWEEANSVPEWVDWEQIKRGQEVFWRYAAPIMTAFAFHLLVGTTGSSQRPAETISRTGGHNLKQARYRFFETFQMLLQVNMGVDDMKPGGAGHASTIRIRLLHASVRSRIMKLAAARPTYFNSEKFGIPLNNLDLVQALCSFSANIMWVGLPRQGIYVRKEEAKDYIALWRYVGHIMGIPTFGMVNDVKALATMQSTMLEGTVPSKTSQALAGNGVSCLVGLAPTYASKQYFEAGSRWLNGGLLCDAMDIADPGWYYWMIMAGQTGMFIIISYLFRAIPALDQWNINATRSLFWEYIVEGEGGLQGKLSTFDFKYLPQLDAQTELEQAESIKPTQWGIERIGMIAFLVEISILALVAFLAVTVVLSFTGFPALAVIRSQFSVASAKLL